MKVHGSAMAYRDGLSILHNAKFHRNHRFFIKLDLMDFFPSIKFKDLEPIILKWHKIAKPDWDFNYDTKELIRNICFFKEDRLAIGYPSSPIISNIVMYNFDVRVNNLISDNKFGKSLYTRYADDLVFSTDKKGACKKILLEVEKLIKSTKSPNIALNHSKTRFSSSTGGSATITGLRICQDGHITINRKQKDHIRLLFSLYAKGELDEKEYPSLLGHLAYVFYVAPQFYSTLSKKYFKEIHELRTKVL